MLVELTFFVSGANLHTRWRFESQEASVCISRGQIETMKRISGVGERSVNNEGSMAQKED